MDISYLFKIVFICFCFNAIFKTCIVLKAKSLYLFSPLILLDFSLIQGVGIPLWISSIGMEYRKEFYIVAIYAMASITIISFLFRDCYTSKIKLDNKIHINLFKEKVFIVIMFGFIFAYAIKSGVLLGLLRGANIEGLRRENEVGLGFIKEIPNFIILYLFSFIALTKAKKEWPFVVFLSLFYAIIFFLATGHKASFLHGATIFMLYFMLKFRPLKLHEYVIYSLLIPITAGFLQAVRGGDLSTLSDKILEFSTYSALLWVVNTTNIVNAVLDSGNFLYGFEYFTSLVMIIPRFLWPSKPLSADYTYKEIGNLQFEGGGAPMPLAYTTYINSGDFFFILYPLIIISFFVMYRKMTKEKKLWKICFYVGFVPLLLSLSWFRNLEFALLSAFLYIVFVNVSFYITNKKTKTIFLKYAR